MGQNKERGEPLIKHEARKRTPTNNGHGFRALASATLLLFLLVVSTTFSSFPANIIGNWGTVVLSSSNDSSRHALLSTALQTEQQAVLPNNEAIVGASLEMFAYNPSTIQTTIANIAASGATGVRIFAAWSNVEPSPGQYNVATILATVQTALSHDMTIILNLNDHEIPSWFQSQFTNFVTNQTGGYVKNWNTITPSLADHGETKAWFDVVGNISQTIASNFGANNPRIVIGVTNEDHYTNVVREIGDYSPATVNVWRIWLSQRFGNNIGNFNNAVNGSVASFDGISPPIDTSNLQLEYYWRYFNSLLIEQFNANAAHVAKTYYSGPVMVTVMPTFMLGTGASAGPLPTLYNSSDIDIIGLNFFPKGMYETYLLTAAVDEMRSLYPSKLIWISEINTLSGGYEPNVVTTWFDESVATEYLVSFGGIGGILPSRIDGD